MQNRHKKIAIIHIAKNELKLTDEEYISILMGAANIQSSKEIETELQYSSIMTAFKKLGFIPRPVNQNPKQINYIKLLWFHASDKKDSKSLDSFCYRITGKKLNFLQKSHATEVINALRIM